MPTLTTTVQQEERRYRTGTFLAAESAPVLRGDGARPELTRRIFEGETPPSTAAAPFRP